MDNKLSELSKPVQIFKHPSGRNFWSVSADSNAGQQDVEAFYSQEYVSALLADSEYMRWRIKEIDLLFGQMLLTMQAAVIEIEHGEGPNAAMAWIVNKLAGPGEFAPDSEKDAQAYFNRESEKIDVEYSKCMDFFESRRKAMKEQSNG
ncbi:hypothetical protein PTT73_18755 [Serratia ureilytica]|uniref:hypothetical protein n=1 Tax=Serratia ureilytica TaxID=300181 RepID=UPI00313EDF90